MTTKVICDNPGCGKEVDQKALKLIWKQNIHMHGEHYVAVESDFCSVRCAKEFIERALNAGN
jgi:hypothetical protein